jgi:hypothetical protein
VKSRMRSPFYHRLKAAFIISRNGHDIVENRIQGLPVLH